MKSTYDLEKTQYNLQTDNFNKAMKQIKWFKVKEAIGGGIIVLLVVLNLIK
jgi:hypothetical protein